MRQFRLAMSILAVATAAAGCGTKSEADRTATRVLRPEEVKISLGSDAAANSVPAVDQTPPTTAP